MMCVPFAIDDKHYSVFVVLEDENLERMRAYDPAELVLSKVEGNFPGKRLKDIVIGYATAADVAEVLRLANDGKPREALKYLSRGWAFKPEAGDYDGPYLSVKKQAGESTQ